MVTDPPEVFSLPVILCPSCGHGIDPHGLDPGGRCGVGSWDEATQTNTLCFCMWSPNDVAATLIAAEHERIGEVWNITVRTAEQERIEREVTALKPYEEGRVSKGLVLAIIRNEIASE